MTAEVEVDPELAVRAAKIAEARGERLEDVIARALKEYVHGDAAVRSPTAASDANSYSAE